MLDMEFGDNQRMLKTNYLDMYEEFTQIWYIQIDLMRVHILAQHTWEKQTYQVEPR